MRFLRGARVSTHNGDIPSVPNDNGLLRS